jgi:hypothetical protein
MMADAQPITQDDRFGRDIRRRFVEVDRTTSLRQMANIRAQGRLRLQTLSAMWRKAAATVAANIDKE